MAMPFENDGEKTYVGKSYKKCKLPDIPHATLSLADAAVQFSDSITDTPQCTTIACTLTLMPILCGRTGLLFRTERRLIVRWTCFLFDVCVDEIWVPCHNVNTNTLSGSFGTSINPVNVSIKIISTFCLLVNNWWFNVFKPSHTPSVVIVHIRSQNVHDCSDPLTPGVVQVALVTITAQGNGTSW